MSPVTPAAVSETVMTQGAGRKPAETLDDGRVAQWLARHPEFFDSHADLLADVRLRHGHRGKAVSLIERQVAVLRERNQALEARLDELIRIGQENDALVARLHRLNRELLRTADPLALPAVLDDGLRQIFSVPQLAIRLWGIGEPVSAEIRRTADAMAQPYCGPSVFPEAAGWLAGAGADTASVALFALRVGAKPEAFGLVVMGSPDAGRFQAGMGTAFLEQLAELASASLSRVRSAG